eukprot:4788261-Pleurochrysis_carterae.AAC.2
MAVNWRQMGRSNGIGHTLRRFVASMHDVQCGGAMGAAVPIPNCRFSTAREHPSDAVQGVQSMLPVTALREEEAMMRDAAARFAAEQVAPH